MSDFQARPLSASVNAFLLVPILLLFMLLIVAVLRSPQLLSSAGIGSAVIVVAPLVLATYALMAVAIAGRATVDLSVGPLIGFINVTLVQLHEADLISSPLAFFLFALAVGIAYQLLMGLIIIFVRVQPIIVALSGFLALSGINLVIMSRPGGAVPEWMMPWGLGTSIYSPVLVMLILATAGWLLFSRTAFFGHMRLMGSDERAAYTSGVHITIVRLGAHVIAGIFSALAGLSLTALIGSGDPTQGTTYTLIAVTALVLGGTSLAGGRGGIIGSLLGAVNLFLIGYVLATFNFGAIQGFVTDVAYGVILVISLLLTVGLPRIQRYIRMISPYMLFVVLFLGFVGVSLHASYDYGRLNGTTVAQENTETLPAQDEASPVAASDEPKPSDAATPESMAAVTPAPTEAAAPPATVAAEMPGEPAAAPPAPDRATPAAVPDPTTPDVAASTPAPELALVVPEQSQKSPSAVPASSALARFIFEPAGDSPAPNDSRLAKPLAFAAIVIVALVVILRAMVMQTGSKTMTPLVFVMIAALILLGAYLLATSSYLPPVTNTLIEGRAR
jgi:ribose transport system permease protein